MEIKPQDLRLGNWVKHPNKDDVYQVEEISSTLTVRAIELTPEWLERFGFEYAEGFADDYTKQPITVYNNPFKVGWTVENLFNQQIKEDILVLRYVHQLQNLFYALTGEELAIDKTSLKN